MTIDANVRTPEQLFNRSVRYVVPAYQRKYVWGQDEQWEPLWEDVKRLAETYLELTSSDGTQVTDDDVPKHFLGAVVLQQEVTPTGSIEMRRVIDGQQRLTTLQILLDAVQEVYENSAHDMEARRLERLVLNDELDTGEDEDARYKVWPTTSDQAEFRFAMRNDATGQRPDESLIVDAHDYFKDQVDRWLVENESIPNAAEGLRIVLSRMLQVVVIDLDAQAEPQVIFETLNARGTPLLQADLVRNYMIFKARAEGLREDDFNEKWLVPFDTSWWDEELRFGARLRPRFEQFLYYWVTMRTVEDIRVDDVFVRFRRYVDDQTVGIEQIAEDVQRCADIYREVELAREDGPFGRWLSYLRCRQPLIIGVDAPLVMWLLDNEMDDNERDRSFAALESWFVRRVLWGRQSTGLVQVLLGLLARLNRLPEKGPVSQTIVEYFSQHPSYRMVWTPDEEFLVTLASYKAYGRLARPRVAFLLERLEMALRSDQTELTPLPKNLQIEHIMPRRWETHWPLESKSDSEQTEERQTRNHWMNCLGNLTLVTPKYNGSVSNRGWDRKGPALDANSVLFLNKDVVTQGEDSWTIADIEERSERLAELALEIWPGPDKF